MRNPTPKTILLCSLFGSLLALSAGAQTTVVSADPLGNPNGVTVLYSAAMDPASSATAGNYHLVNSGNSAVLPITSATLQPDQVTVQLQLGSSLQFTTNYTLTISNVKDAGLALISPNPTVTNFYFGGNPNGPTFTFESGLVPPNTWLSSNTVDTAGNGLNPYLSVTNLGGVNNSGMLLLTANPVAPGRVGGVPAGQAYAQWHLGDMAGGRPVTNLTLAFDLFYGNGTGGNTTSLFTDAAHAGGNGLVFHWGPGLNPNGVDQYTGGASSWGVAGQRAGLDVTFRIYNSSPNTPGINIYYGGTAGAGANTPVATNSYMDYFTGNFVNTWPGNTTDPTEIGFSTNYTHAVLNVVVTTDSSTYTNASISLTCSNLWSGLTNIFTSQVISNFTTPLANQPMAFTATDGAGGHSDGFLDNVDFTVNGTHIISGLPVGPVGVATQPSSQAVPENVYVTFNVGVTGAPPYFYQWYSNSVAIPGANAADYRTPLTLFNMNGSAYSVLVSNSFSSTISSNAILTVIQDTVGAHVLSVGSLDGNSIGVLFDAYVDTTTAGNPANYSVNGGAISVTAADPRTAIANFGDPVFNYPNSYLKTVRLTLASPVTSGYIVTVKSGVKSRTGLSVVQTNLTGRVEAMTDLDLGTPGTDPLATGQALAIGTNQIQVVGGGSNFLPVGSGPSDAGHFAYSATARTGNFDVIADLTFETPTATVAKGGLQVRPNPTDPSSPAIALEVFPQAGNNTYQTGMRVSEGVTGTSWSAIASANGNAPTAWPNNWMRIRRVGPIFYGYNSPDGSTWTLIAQTTQDPTSSSFPSTEYLGVMAAAANNDGRLCEADYSAFAPLVYPGAVVSITNNLKANYPGYANARTSFGIGATVSGFNVFQTDLAYQWQRAEPSTPTVFNDITDGTGNAPSYTTLTLSVGNDNGAKYRAIAYVGDITTGHNATSAVATLTVTVQTNAPYMTSASADATFLSVSINFSFAMDSGSLSTVGNYSLVPVGGGSALIIDSATPTLSADGVTYTNVVLAIDGSTPLVPGVKYTLTVANIVDAAGNNINNTTVPGGKQRIVTGWVLAYGYLKYERWLMPGITGNPETDVSTMLNSGILSTTPNVTQLITYSGYPNGDIANPSVNILDFGARISGYFIPPATDSYSWYARGNDGSAIWVSGDNNPPDVVNTLHKAAYNRAGGYAAPGASWFDSQTNLSWVVVNGNFPDTSAASMNAGQLYAVTALEKQGTGTAWLEYTWGTSGTTTFGGDNLTNAAGGAYPTGTAPARGGAPTNSYNLKGTNIAIYVNPDVSVITANGPTNTTVVQYRMGFLAVVGASAVVSVGAASSAVPVAYQWLSNAIPLVGATNATYTTPMLTDTNHTIQYAAVLSVPGLSFMTITNSATVSVVPDTTPPLVQSASGFGSTIGIRYQELMDAASVTNAANYTGVTGGLSVTKVLLRPDGQTVLLYLSGALAGPTFSVTINNVKDIGGNLIAPNTIATGNVVFTQMTALDIGVGTNNLGAGVVQTNATLTNVTFDVNFPGSTVSAQDAVFETVASGQGFGTNGFGAGTTMGTSSFQDGVHFIYEQRTGDFDVKVRVERIDGSDARAKAGLMMRAALAPGALEYLIGVEPAATNAADGSGVGYNGVTLLRRQTNNSFVTTLANNPAAPVLGNVGGGLTNQYPIWLRMRRTGSSFYFYTGADGTNWYLCGRATGQTTWPATTFIGMATTAANPSAYTQSRFTQYGNFVAPPRPQVLLVGLDNSITGSGPIDNPSGNPNAPSLWLPADLYMYNLFINQGYSVTVVADATARAEDATGMSLVFWDGTSSSANLGGTPSTFTYAPVPVVQAKDATLEKEYWVKNANDRGGATSQTALKIVNTNNPIVKGLYQMNQNVQVNTTGQTFTLALTNTPGVSGLGSNFVVVATTTTNTGVATIYYADKATNGLWQSAPNNYIAHRRVGLWLGDGNSGYGSSHAGGNPAGDFSTVTSDGLTLLLNAIKWAIATNELPAISNQPANQFALAGTSATFSVTPGGPGGPFTYQWYKNNLSSPVSGATYADYVTPATVLGDSGSSYQVVVSGPNGSVTSSVATLTVLNAVGITGQPQNARVATNHSASFSVTATSGGGTLTYQWFSNAVLVTGATAATYNTPGLPLAASGAQYFVAVANQVSTLNSATAIVTVVNPPVIILSGKTLTWSGGGNLQAATNVTGPYTNVPGAASPYTFTVSPGVPQLYYRVQQ